MLGIAGLVSSSIIDSSATPTKNRTRQPARRVPSSAAGSVDLSTTQQPTLAITRAEVSLEYAALRHQGHCPLGMYVKPSPTDLLVWDAVFFVHQGYYADSVLRFRLVFPPQYPNRPPAVQFLTDVFHPLVSQQDGSFNLAPRFRPWRPKEHQVFHVLHWIKAAFKKHALDLIKEDDCFNKEAYKYHDTTSSFAALATQSSALSRSTVALFDRDHPSMAAKGQHGMQFRELKHEQLDALRTQLGLTDWDEVPEP